MSYSEFSVVACTGVLISPKPDGEGKMQRLSEV